MRTWAAIAVASIVLVGLVAYFVRPVDESSPVVSASAPIVSLIELREGDQLDGWRVDKIFPQPEAGVARLAIQMSRGGSGITVWISRKEDVAKPPVVTAKYALTHGDPRAYGAPIPPDAFESMTNKIADRVRRNEATTPTPPGLY